MKKYIVEFIATFFLILTIGTAAVYGASGAYAPFAIGIVLVVLVYAGGHISGAHYNPAVSLGLLLRGGFSKKDFIPYIIVQLLAAVVAWLVVSKLLAPGIAGAGEIKPHEFTSTVPVLAAEFLFTFALVYVILNVATAKGTEGNSFYGIAIGGTVLAGALTVGSISLGGFNPAVSIALVLMGKLQAADLWMHLVPQFLAGAVAAITFKATISEE